MLFSHIKSKCEEREKIVVHCDSMSALLTLKGERSEDIFGKQKDDILKILHHLITRMNIDIFLHWVPSHIGIPGNEQVDGTVKDALNNAIIDVVIPPSIGQIRAIIRKSQKKQQHQLFDQCTASSINTRAVLQMRHYKASNPNLKPQSRSKLAPQSSVA